MKIILPVEQAQLCLTILRSAGAKAVLFSVAHERNEAIIVTDTIPASVEQEIKALASHFEEEKQ